jgi:hypothetical protein
MSAALPWNDSREELTAYERVPATGVPSGYLKFNVRGGPEGADVMGRISIAEHLAPPTKLSSSTVNVPLLTAATALFVSAESAPTSWKMSTLEKANTPCTLMFMTREPTLK